MTEDDALLFYEMLDQRLSGWSIPLSMNPRTGATDHRTRQAKAEHVFMLDVSLNRGSLDETVAALMVGRCMSTVWPEPMREVIAFRLNHKVPRPINEPTSSISVALRAEIGNPRFPDWMLAHGIPAAAGDHPPYPEPSELYLAWRKKPMRKPPPNVIPFPGKWKGAA